MKRRKRMTAEQRRLWERANHCMDWYWTVAFGHHCDPRFCPFNWDDGDGEHTWWHDDAASLALDGFDPKVLP